MIRKIFSLLKRIVFNLLFLISPEHKRSRIIRLFFKCTVGKNVKWTGMPVFASEPELITIGNNVTIARNVVFHTHDGGVRLFRDEYPTINVFGKITIGNNVFIGSDSIILPNTRIGNNVIIGSGSVVSKDIEDDSVAAGVPAKKIKTLEEYKKSVLEKATF